MEKLIIDCFFLHYDFIVTKGNFSLNATVSPNFVTQALYSAESLFYFKIVDGQTWIMPDKKILALLLKVIPLRGLRRQKGLAFLIP